MGERIEDCGWRRGGVSAERLAEGGGEGGGGDGVEEGVGGVEGDGGAVFVVAGAGGDEAAVVGFADFVPAIAGGLPGAGVYGAQFGGGFEEGAEVLEGGAEFAAPGVGDGACAQAGEGGPGRGERRGWRVENGG